MKEKGQLMKHSKEQLQKGKRGLLSIVFGRTGIIILLVLIQVGFLLLLFQFLRDYVFTFYWATVFLGFCLVVAMIGKPGNPAFKISWIVPILMFQLFGALFYLYMNTQLGSFRLNKRIREEAASTSDLIEQSEKVMEELKEQSPQMAHLASYLKHTSKSAVHQNTEAQYFPCGEELMEPLLQELRKAEKFIFVEYFIIDFGYMWESVLEVLKAKVKEGVEVRLLYDGMNDLYRLPRKYPQQLAEYGIQCREFAPIIPALTTIQNNRDHRKILVIDGHTAFTGGINLANEYINRKERFGYWKDSVIMLKGEAVGEFTRMFLQLWNVVEKKKTPCNYKKYLQPSYDKEIQVNGSGFVIPYDDNPLDGEQVGENVYIDMLYSARSYVHIMTPYLVLDHEMIVALTYAAKRGIDVKIIMPHIPDKMYAFLLARTYYNELLDAGVEIYEFIPGFVHTKAVVSDDEKAVAGSINMDFRSFYLSFECAALLYRNKAVMQIEDDFQKTLQQCVKVTKEVYSSQPLVNKVLGKLMRLFAPMM